ncbi:phosphotransferase [Actinopolymorpha sp. B17G11]|uniref:phosphotransferase n=1 Tax=Actinopolymorpha sp. B17G11 TaxID=3160861 RepID=UPI0032E3D825
MGDGPREWIAEINHRTGSGLSFVEVAAQGESGGAAFVRWPDGRDGVVTHAPIPPRQARQTAEVLATVRAAGLPVPRHDLVLELADGTAAVVQERLPGSPPRRTDVHAIEAMLAINERFARLLADRPDVVIPPLYLRKSGPVFPRHETLAGYSDRSRRLLRLIREVGNAERHEMAGDDLVHTDFTVPNVLFDDSGQVTGVVDWNFGVARGDRHFALVGLRFDLTWAAAAPDGGYNGVERKAIDRVDEALETTMTPQLLRMYWAYWTLYKLHWVIRSGIRSVIDLHLRLGESRLL